MFFGAFPWNNDLTVKTNLGHKFVIKESTLKVSDKGKSDLLDLIEKRREEEEKLYFIAGCHDPERRIEFVCSSYSYYEKGYFRFEKNTVEALKLDDEIIYKAIKFRPIFIDLNKNKTPLKTSTVLCARDSLEASIKLFIVHYDNYHLRKIKEKPYGFYAGKRLVGNLIKEKICKKYYDGFSNYVH